MIDFSQMKHPDQYKKNIIKILKISSMSLSYLHVLLKTFTLSIVIFEIEHQIRI